MTQNSFLTLNSNPGLTEPKPGLMYSMIHTQFNSNLIIPLIYVAIIIYT